MINEERVRIMTKMAAYESGEGKKCRPMAEYYRKDYVSKEILISIITGTIAFFLVLGVILLGDLESFVNSLTTLDVKQTLIMLLIRYGIFMAIYLGITYIVYNYRYSKGRKKVKIFYSRLSAMEKLYAEEEQQKKPTGGAV